jgi:hypothetical protein
MSPFVLDKIVKNVNIILGPRHNCTIEIVDHGFFFIDWHQ